MNDHRKNSFFLQGQLHLSITFYTEHVLIVPIYATSFKEKISFMTYRGMDLEQSIRLACVIQLLPDLKRVCDKQE